MFTADKPPLPSAPPTHLADHVITAKQHIDHFYSRYYRKLCVNKFAKMTFLPHNYRKAILRWQSLCLSLRRLRLFPPRIQTFLGVDKQCLQW